MFTLNTEKKLNARMSAADNAISYDTIANVPGILTFKIFVQKTRYVMMPDGSEAIITIGHSNNPDYVAAYGKYFALVGKKFLKMSHREQIAHLYNAVRQIRMDAEVRELMDIIRSICKNESYERDVVSFHKDTQIEVEVKPDSAARRYVDLARLVGEKTARKVIMDSVNLSMKTSKLMAKVEAKEAVRAGTIYDSKMYKAVYKLARKDNIKNLKTNIKTAKANAAQANKAAKAEKKAAAQDPLDAEAATIPQGEPA